MRIFVFAFVFCATIAGSFSRAQTTSGTILGIVTDNSGAVIPDANVTVTNVDTQVKNSALSDGLGSYQFVNLPPGNYTVDVQKTGFVHLKRGPVALEVQGSLKLNALLQVGDLTQTVNVDTSVPLVETQPGSLGQTIEGKVVQQMPLNGRNVLNLLELAPGVVPQGSVSGNPLGNQSGGSLTNNTGFGNYQIGGGMANQSAFYLDGVPLNTSYINSPALIPTQDAVQEFRVDSNAVSAEFGRFAGGVVNMATKSGTDAFHGSAYEYIRNKIFNANTYFNKRNGTPNPAFTQNQFGATVGGPVIHQKLFFFFSWEGYSFRRGNPVTASVPTQAMRGGDFSGICSSFDPNGLCNAPATISGPNGTPIQNPNAFQLYDPLTTCGINGAPLCPAGQTAVRNYFPFNKIPTSRLDPAAAATINYYGLPNAVGSSTAGAVNNYITNTKIGGNTNQYNARGDWSLSDKQRIFARYSWWGGSSIPSDTFGTHYGGLSSYTGSQDFVVGDTYNFNQHTIGDFRVSYVRATDGFIPEQFGYSLSQFGPGYTSLQSQLTIPVTPLATISGFTGFGGTYNRSFINNYSISASLIKILGRHTLKMGGEVRRYDWNFIQGTTSAGSFSFDNTFTSANPLSPSGSGYSFASFYLGNPASGSLTGTAQTDAIQYYTGLYLQDTYQITRKLTLTPGVRWDLPQGNTEKHDRLTVLLPNAADPLGQQAGLPNLTGQLALVNSSAYPSRSYIAEHYKLFAPRVNAAYAPNENTSIRAGYGLSWIPPDMVNYSLSPFQSPVNASTTTAVPSVNGTSSIYPAATFGNPFPGGLVPTIGHNPSQLSIFEGQSISSPIPNEAYGYVQQWNFEIQQQLASNLSFNIGYAGSKGTHLSFSTFQLNQIPDSDLALGSALNTSVPNPFYGHVTNGLLAAPTVSRAQLLRPHPQFQNFQDTAGQKGDSHWNALETRIQKRFHTGGVLMGSYTWAKLISDTDTLTSWLEGHGTGGVQDYNNLAGEKSLASFDVRNRIVVSYVMDLPFGQNHAFLSNVGPVTNHIIGGWAVNGITILQSGFPLALTTASNVTGSQGGGSRPNLTGASKQITGAAQTRLTQWFNTGAFAQPAAFTFGNESRVDNTLRGPGIANWDFTVSKNIPITERYNFEFKTEIFNLFNRVQFADPNTQLGSATFGQVTATNASWNPRLIQFAGRLNF